LSNRHSLNVLRWSTRTKSMIELAQEPTGWKARRKDLDLCVR